MQSIEITHNNPIEFVDGFVDELFEGEVPQQMSIHLQHGKVGVRSRCVGDLQLLLRWVVCFGDFNDLSVSFDGINYHHLFSI